MKSDVPRKFPLISEVVQHCRNLDSESTVLDHFSVGDLLGKGAFASCYVATSRITNKKFALKVIQKSLFRKNVVKNKLQNEICIHSSLSHPNIVGFNDFFVNSGNLYMKLELCSNRSMSSLLSDAICFSDHVTRKYMAQLVDAVYFLHRSGIIHRDLKLDNLFLDDDWNVKIGDFGLAVKLCHEDDRQNTMCGTPNYMAPEVITGKRGHSFEVDIWSLGIIMYEMLVGVTPFECQEIDATYQRILNNNYSFSKQSGVSNTAEDVIRSMLQTLPSNRASLEQILNSEFMKNGDFPKNFPLYKYYIDERNEKYQSVKSSVTALDAYQKDTNEDAITLKLQAYRTRLQKISDKNLSNSAKIVVENQCIFCPNVCRAATSTNHIEIKLQKFRSRIEHTSDECANRTTKIYYLNCISDNSKNIESDSKTAKLEAYRLRLQKLVERNALKYNDIGTFNLFREIDKPIKETDMSKRIAYFSAKYELPLHAG